MVAHKEIELKFPLTENEYQRVLENLSQKLPRVNLLQNDFVIKTKAGENVRVREENKTAVLTHKRRIYNDKGAFLYCREAECAVDKSHIKEISDILKELGVDSPEAHICENLDLFKEFLKNALAQQTAYQVHIHKKRIEFKKGNYTYVLDEVKKLGYFLEIELLVPLNDQTDEVDLRRALCGKLVELDLTDRDPLLQGYTVLMHEKGG